MSTSKNLSVQFAKVYSKSSRNGRSIEYYGTAQEAKAIQQSLATDGWKDQFPALIEAFPKTEKDAAIAECLAERQTQWDAIKASGDGVKRLVFERLFVVKGKLIEPEYYRVSGFRRAANYLEAMCLRHEAMKTVAKPDEDGATGHTWDDTDIITMVPCIVKVFSSELERLLEQQFENTLVDVGRSPIIEKDKLRIVKQLIAWGANSNDVRKLYGSIGQKYYGLVKCNDFWPNLRIFDRCLLPDDDSSSIPIKTVKHEKTSSFTARHRNDAKGQGRNPKELPIAEQEVREYFDGLKGKPPSTPMLGKTDIRDMSESNDITLVRLAMGAVLNNDKSQLVALANGKDALNAATEMVMSGDGQRALLGLRYAKDCSELLYAIENAIKSGTSVEQLMAAIKGTYHVPAVV